MQRRHAIIAAIALGALVLIPVAALAHGFHGGPGHRGWQGADKAFNGTPALAPNTTHTNWTLGHSPGARPLQGNATRAADPSCVHDTANRTCASERIGSPGAVNGTCLPGDGRNPGPRGRAGLGSGR